MGRRRGVDAVTLHGRVKLNARRVQPHVGRARPGRQTVRQADPVDVRSARIVQVHLRPENTAVRGEVHRARRTLPGHRMRRRVRQVGIQRVPECAGVEGAQHVGSIRSAQGCQRHTRLRGVHEDAFHRSGGAAGIRRQEARAVIPRNQNPAVGGPQVHRPLAPAIRRRQYAGTLGIQPEARRFAGHAVVLHRLPHRPARRQFHSAHRVDFRARARRAARRRQNSLHPQVGQEFVQPRPGEPAIQRAPHAEIVGHHDLILVGRGYRHAALPQADHRFRLEGGQVSPTAPAVVGAEQVAAHRVDPAESRRHQARSVFRSSDHLRRRLHRRFHHIQTRQPNLVIGSLEDLAGARASVECAATVGKPDFVHRTGGRRGQQQVYRGIAHSPPVGALRGRQTCQRQQQNRAAHCPSDCSLMTHCRVPFYLTYRLTA